MSVKYTLGTYFVRQYKLSRLDARARGLKKADFLMFYIINNFRAHFREMGLFNTP